MKKAMILLLLLFSFICGCGQNENTDTIYIDDGQFVSVRQLISQQVATPEKKLIYYGYENKDLLFVHRIGTVSSVFVGFLTDAQYYDGASSASISSQKSTALINEKNYSIANIQKQTNELNVSTELPFKGSVNPGDSYMWTPGSEATVGTSVSEMIEKSRSFTYILSPEMGAGYYAIVAFARYSVYQYTIYDNIANTIVDSKISFANSANEEGMNLYLAKADNLDEFNTVLEGINPGLSVIKSLDQDEIDLCRSFVKTQLGNEFSAKWGNETLYDDIWFSSDFSNYEKLDTISNILRSNQCKVSIGKMRAGYSKVQINLNYTYHSELLSNVRIQIKIRNLTTGIDYGETAEHIPDGQFSCIIDLLDISENDVIEIQVRQRKVVGIKGGGIRFYANREYEFLFS